MYSGDIIVDPVNGRATNVSDKAAKIAIPIVIFIVIGFVSVIVIFMKEANGLGGPAHNAYQ